MQLCPKQKAQDSTYAEPLHKLMVTEPVLLSGLELLGEVSVKVGEVRRYLCMTTDPFTCLIRGSHESTLAADLLIIPTLVFGTAAKLG